MNRKCPVEERGDKGETRNVLGTDVRNHRCEGEASEFENWSILV